jgi:IS5 family transposase
VQVGFFEISDSYARLDKAGDPLAKLNSMINWSGLGEILTPLSHESGSVKGGRPGYDTILIVKCLILQSLYNISDDSCEYQVNDRLSFKRFLGLSTSRKAPDAKTLWHWRERIKHKNLDKAIFAWFSVKLDEAGYRAEKGQIIDASFVPTHKPTGRHKKQLRDEIPLTAAQAAQIDNEASFTKKNKMSYHGYKNHVNVDNKHKLIREQEVTTASRHDSQEFDEIVVLKEGEEVFADSAYRSEKTEAILSAHKVTSQIHERAYRNTPLTEAQKVSNKAKSTIRVRVEHVFGHMETAMGGMAIHTIGLARAKVKMTFKNLAYNMHRFAYLQSRKLQAA